MTKKHRTIETTAGDHPSPSMGSGLNTAVTKVEVRREGTRSPDFVSLYANDIQIQTTPWDLRVTLGEISSGPSAAAPAANMNIRELGVVHMSPQLAKQFTMIMLAQLKAYEEQFGEIPMPKV